MTFSASSTGTNGKFPITEEGINEAEADSSFSVVDTNLPNSGGISSSGGDGLSNGEAAGIGIGVGVAVMAAAGAVYYFRFYKHPRLGRPIQASQWDFQLP